jgi:hypothetical protein
LTAQIFALNLNFPKLDFDFMYTEGLINMYKRPGMQEIESILDNPAEMAEMSLANKEAALDAEAEQVRNPCIGPCDTSQLSSFMQPTFPVQMKANSYTCEVTW